MILSKNNIDRLKLRNFLESQNWIQLFKKFNAYISSIILTLEEAAYRSAMSDKSNNSTATNETITIYNF